MENSYQRENITQILEAIINESTFEGESRSNIADILLSILNNTSYDKEPRSAIAQLLLRLKAKIAGESFDPYTGETTGNIAEILLSILNETEYTDDPRSNVAELLLELKEKLESLTEITVSGSVASFITNVALPLVSSKFEIAPTLDGVNSVNVVRTGANVWQLDETGIGKNYDGYANVKRYSQTIKMPFGTYTFSCNGSISSFSSVAVGISKKPIGNTLNLNNDTQRNSITPNTPRTVTLTSEYPYLFILGIANGDTMTKSIMEELSLMINVGNQATNYAAYQAATRTINLGSTVYGGEVTIDENGECDLKSTYCTPIDLGSLDWTFYSNAAYPYMMASISGYKWVNNNPNVECEGYNFASIGSSGNAEGFFITNTNIIRIRDLNYQTAESLTDFKTHVTGLNLSYEVTTPTESDLDPINPIDTLIGQNNVYCDTGESEVTFYYRGESPVNRGASKNISNEDIIKEEDTPEEIEKEER